MPFAELNLSNCQLFYCLNFVVATERVCVCVCLGREENE